MNFYSLLKIVENNEPFYNEYKEILFEINSIVKSQKFPIEGNLFYLDQDKDLSNLYEPFLVKRRNLTIFSTLCDVIVEIGFNAGHSALLALTTNEKLLYRGVDINDHQYVIPCYQCLKNHFQNRISLSFGESKFVVPNIKKIYPELNTLKVGWIIDGSHDPKDVIIDIHNVLAQANKNDLIMFDDADMPFLRDIIVAFALDEKIQILYDFKFSIFFKAL